MHGPSTEHGFLVGGQRRPQLAWLGLNSRAGILHLRCFPRSWSQQRGQRWTPGALSTPWWPGQQRQRSRGVLWQPRPGAHISPVGEGAPDRCSFLPSHHRWCRGRRRGETRIIIAGYSGNTGGAEAVRDLGRAASWGFHGDQQIALGILALSLDQVWT